MMTKEETKKYIQGSDYKLPETVTYKGRELNLEALIEIEIERKKAKVTKEEVDLEVNFKMDEFFTSLENQIKQNWSIAFHHNSQKHTHYWEAMKKIKEAFYKEIQMKSPFERDYTYYKDISLQENELMRRKRDEFVDKAITEFLPIIRGRGVEMRIRRHLSTLFEQSLREF